MRRACLTAASVLALIAWSSPRSAGSQAAPLRWRIGIEQDGIYRISGANLQAVGMDIAAVDPDRLRISRGDQALAIQVLGAADGRFDLDDEIRFYGLRRRPAPGVVKLGARRFPIVVGETKYGFEAAYWLDEAEPGIEAPRWNSRAAPSQNAGPPVSQSRHETRFESYDEWFTHHFSDDDTRFIIELKPGRAPVLTHTVTVTLHAPAPDGAPAEVVAELVSSVGRASTNPDHHSQLVWGDLPEPLADDYWDGISRHRLEGQVSASMLADGPNPISVVLVQDAGVTNTARMNFDDVSIRYDRLLQAEADALRFELPANTTPDRDVQLSGFSSPDILALDVSQPHAPVALSQAQPEQAGGQHGLRFGLDQRAANPEGWRFAAATDEGLLAPDSLRRQVLDDLHAPDEGADHLIIVPDVLSDAAERLAQHRRAEGLRSRLVDLQAVLDGFGDGDYDPGAIREFLAHAHANWPAPAPQYVVLVGDGHWDFMTERRETILMPPNLIWADPWQGEIDSANDLADFLGRDGLADLAIGRIPVRSPEELDAVIDKILAYESGTQPDCVKAHAFVADDTPDPDRAGDFVLVTERFIRDMLPESVEALRIYEDDFVDPGNCGDRDGPRACPAANQAIVDMINADRAALINFVGHASVERWSHRAIFHNTDLARLSNQACLPIVLSWTCLDGYWIYPGRESLAEEALRLPGAGPVATFSPTGLGVVSGHDILQRGLYEAIFDKGVDRLGLASLEALRILKETGLSPDLLATYTLFGDPALKLRLVPSDPVFLPWLSTRQAGALDLDIALRRLREGRR